jgi:RNA polymerase sigma-70 factor (ECF subfamily)
MGLERANSVGESGAFERVYEELARTVYSAAFRVLGNSAQSQDIVQDVFLRLWHQPERFDATRGTLVGYVRLMARSRALDVWREAQIAGRAKDRMKVVVGGEEARPEERPPQAAELRRDRLIVLGGLAELPRPQRQAIVMAYWGGLTAEEIAERSGVPVGTVKSRIRLALIKLREVCEPELAVA